jgi:DNA polymerase III delta prime subunit
MATDTTQRRRPQVLLQFVGNQHNDPARGEGRPGVRVARMGDLAPLAQVFLLRTGGDDTAARFADALARELGKDQRGGVKVSQRALDAGAPPDPTAQRNVREAVEDFAEFLATEGFGARFDEVDFVVSTVTGTPAQWTCLVDALDARGARIALVCEGAEGELSVWRAPDDARGSEPELRLLERAPAAWNVLLTGPTGAGKTATARRLHGAWKANLQRAGDFVAVNAGALPPHLLQSELFGHVKGAYTGAERSRAGAFRRAHGGTLFLDEIGDLPLDLQVQLLTALDVDAARCRTVTPVGADAPESVDVRVVFGTNQDLHGMAGDRRFRLDLLGRISTHHVRLPGLADVRHRIAGAYVHHLEALSPLYPSGDKRGVRFAFEGAARRRLLEFALSPSSRWLWNHRDVQQSAERLAMRAWRGVTGRRDDAPRKATITVAHLEPELAELAARWRALAPDLGDHDDAWRRVASRLRPGEWEKLSMLERWELRYLLEARDASANNAEAWRRIGEQNLLEGASDPASQRNPSNAFNKRWQRYARRMRP